MIDQHLDALALSREERAPLSPIAIAATLALHLLGLAAFWRYEHQPLWLALPTLTVLLVPPILAMRSRRGLAVETLAPLFFLYAALLARYVAVRILLAREPYQDEASFADPRLVFFQVEVTAAVALAYTILVQVVRLGRGVVRMRALVLLAVALGCAAAGWFAVETIGHRTRGVTASDPYAYTQMAVDLATRGTPLHTFPLFRDVVNTDIAWYPIEHVGYRLPINLQGDAATVWPFGGSVWLAAAYRVFGEEGLYLATPLVALVSLVAMAWLAWDYLADKPRIERAAIAGLSVALLATSWEQVDRSIVPLVDAQAQLFSAFAILMALRASRTRRTWILGALAGLALGAAYLVRHTQVLMVFAIIIAAWRLPGRERVKFLVVAALVSFALALPDLWYHHQYLGGWLTPESNELALFAFSNVASSARLLGERFFAGNEFGYLVPFLLYGAYRSARDDAWKFATLAAWVVLLVAFHLMYAAVKVRDLLPEFPALILLSAQGTCSVARDLRGVTQGTAWRRLAVALAIFLALLLPAMRTRLTILRPFQPVKVTFGYVTAAQRAAFDQIAALAPSNAVIGSTMNDGAIDLYARRTTFRPGVWNPDERGRFVELMRREERPVYLLDDGAEMSAARRDLATRYTLREVAVLEVPLFGESDSPGALWEIMR